MPCIDVRTRTTTDEAVVLYPRSARTGHILKQHPPSHGHPRVAARDAAIASLTSPRSCSVPSAVSR
jgi:hypothetical protein